MEKNRIYDTVRESVSENYAERVKIEPSGMTLSLDAILNDCEEIMSRQEKQEPTCPEDTQ